MASFDDVVIISGCRTPVGKFQGSLSDFSAPQLGAIAVREAVKRAGLNSDQIDECIMGNVISAGLGQNPARQAALNRFVALKMGGPSTPAIESCSPVFAPRRKSSPHSIIRTSCKFMTTASMTACRTWRWNTWTVRIWNATSSGTR